MARPSRATITGIVSGLSWRIDNAVRQDVTVLETGSLFAGYDPMFVLGTHKLGGSGALTASYCSTEELVNELHNSANICRWKRFERLATQYPGGESELPICGHCDNQRRFCKNICGMMLSRTSTMRLSTLTRICTYAQT